jgi:hypothetical protein
MYGVFGGSMIKPKVILCDLDGTLCCVNHRRQYVATKARNWDAWNKALVNDIPHLPVLEVIKCISNSYPIIIVSGRSDDYKTQTVEWLRKYDVPYTELYMRKYKDNRDDTIVKSEICDIIEKNCEVFAVFDDRTKVVDMWRQRGYWVFDCNQTREVF